MDINLTVTYKDGTNVEVEVDYVDCIAFERKYQKPLAAIMSTVIEPDGSVRWRYDKAGRKVEPLEVFRAEYLAFLAWSNLSRTAGVEDEFDVWLASLGGVEFGAAPKAKRPTRTRTRSK